MGFAENLRQIRKKKGLSQEELAELAEVSRQAVSKWEQGEGYPETEKLLLLASVLGTSLDSLMTGQIPGPQAKSITGTLVITSPHEHVVAACHKVASSQILKGGKNAPKFGLFGISAGGSVFWGEATTFLGWYADQESLSQEIQGIHRALTQGEGAYTLRHSVKVQRKWLGLKITAE